METNINLTFDEMWDKIIACDHTYDGQFYTAVKTTKIYCRPSCKSRKPKKINVDFTMISIWLNLQVFVLAKGVSQRLSILRTLNLSKM